jgi:hypothetical protein
VVGFVILPSGQKYGDRVTVTFAMPRGAAEGTGPEDTGDELELSSEDATTLVGVVVVGEGGADPV